jgi:hypothetical protein
MVISYSYDGKSSNCIISRKYRIVGAMYWDAKKTKDNYQVQAPT